ncbi:DUF1178 family protein [Aquabacterium sp.]|uniref:DUF1178 family protein n=1 Tax=Aquabacterium sp. TaxID=1872578 RepID=UPI002E327399|nr:DUF1178 family protein [Aquabacterium sp.]HEX5311570.1 DUF1178 family protein [Aquabacterium sp.]
MLVVDLVCADGHRFEGWFQSADDLSSQQARGLLSCPVCGRQEVQRLPSATRYNRNGVGEGGSAPQRLAQPEEPSRMTGLSPDANEVVRELQSAYLHAVRQVIQSTEDVGDRFVDETRKMHHGEEPPRPIRGQATPQEAESLREEGIDVVSFVVPDALKGPVQ